MKNIIVLFVALFSFAALSTSCSKSGCPGHITKEYKINKEVKTTMEAMAIVENMECLN